MITWLRNILTRSIEDPRIPLDQSLEERWRGYEAFRPNGGISVNRETVLSIPAVLKSLRLVGQRAGKLPFTVYRNLPSGGKEVDRTNPAYRLLKLSPAPNVTPMTWKQTAVHHLMIHGNHFSYIHRLPNGDPVKLTILDPERVHAAWEDGRFFYVFDNNGVPVSMLPENVLHIKGLSDDGIMGISPLNALSESLGLSLAIQRFTLHYFTQSGGRPKVALMLPANFGVDDIKLEQFRRTFKNKHSGIDNSEPAIIPFGADLKVIGGGDNTAAQLASVNDNQIRQTANGFSVPGSELGLTAGYTSFNSLEQMIQAFMDSTLDGYLTEFEEVCSLRLLRTAEFENETHTCEFIREAAIQLSPEVRDKLIINQVNNGLMSEEMGQAKLNNPTGMKGSFRRPAGITLWVDGEPVPMAPEPPPAASVSQDEPEAKAEPQETTKSLANALRDDSVRRMMDRLRKAIEDGKHNLEPHRDVLCDTFRHWANGAEATDELLRSISGNVNQREDIPWDQYTAQLLQALGG